MSDHIDDIDDPVIVLDIGSHSIKIGLAGSESPIISPNLSE